MANNDQILEEVSHVSNNNLETNIQTEKSSSEWEEICVSREMRKTLKTMASLTVHIVQDNKNVYTS
jgi:hypothetical protein